MNKNSKHIVCLGGGIGTVNLIKGLKQFTKDIVVVVSMADEGGSSGRLRRLYQIFPPGDIVSCMAAMCDKKNSLVSKLLTFRFPGDRYGHEESLSGHKLGNLLMVAMRDLTGDFNQAILKLQKILGIDGTFLPASIENVRISAKTVEGKIIQGEETIDLGKYTGKRILEEVYLHPKHPKTSDVVVSKLKSADVIIAGPGDLYTTILPVLLMPDIAKTIKKSNAHRLFIVNVANKPFETKDYKVSDYIKAIKKHLGVFPFDCVIANSNHAVDIPKKYHYEYVVCDKNAFLEKIKIVEKDLLDETFPLYHASQKLANAVFGEL